MTPQFRAYILQNGNGYRWEGISIIKRYDQIFRKLSLLNIHMGIAVIEILL